MITILIIDDHPIVREGLEIMLSHRPRFSVQAAVSSGNEAIAWCQANGIPDVILCDVFMPDSDGFTVFSALKKKFPKVKVVFLCGMPRREDEEKARELGASGYMPKSVDTNVLADNIAKVAEGSVRFAAETFETVPTPFTPREEMTLKYLALGKTRDEIAIISGCSSETVKTRITEIRRKLDASNTTAAIARAYELGYLR